jgi:UDP-glucose 4-epimerase
VADGPDVTWVVGAGGLLGQAVVSRLRENGQVVMRVPVPWTDPGTASAALERGLDELLARAEARWSIAWCAGAGGVATGEAALANERLVVDRFLARLAGAVDRAGRASHPGTLFLASSAGGMYGGSDSPPYTEHTAPRPISPYGHAKLAIERAAGTAAEATGVSTFIGRIANLYGPGQRLDSSRGLISQICRAGLLGEPLPVFVPLDTLRDYLYVEDCAAMVVAGLRCVPGRVDPGHPVLTKILASQRAWTIREVIEEFERVVGRPVQVMARDSSTARLQPKDLRVRSVVWPELDSLAQTSLATGIALTYRDVEARLRARRAEPGE